jgi:hypothetical protein
MRTIAQCQKALDMLCERALSRRTAGRPTEVHKVTVAKQAGAGAIIEALGGRRGARRRGGSQPRDGGRLPGPVFRHQ